MDLVPFLASLAAITLAELLDKTQLTMVTLCSRYEPSHVLVGGLSALVLMGGLGVLLGDALTAFVSPSWMEVASGVVFVLLGLHGISSERPEVSRAIRYGSPILSAFLTVVFMELGDKTQLAIIVLSAKYSSPILVLVGASLAFSLVAGLSVALGRTLLRLVPRKHLKRVSDLAFMAFGLFFLLNVVL